MPVGGRKCDLWAVHPRSLPVLLCFLLPCAPLSAQEDSVPVAAPADSLAPVRMEPAVPEIASAPTDTLNWRQRHSPRKAAILSAVLPGAGQIYNRKYWKAPIAWAGLGVSVYFLQDNTKQYRRYKDAYLAIVDGDPTTIDEFEGQYSAQSVLNVTDTYRRWRDLSYIAIGAVYVLNIIDATVDAHFVRFDVSNDLSLRIGPSLDVAAQGGAGLTLSLAVR